MSHEPLSTVEPSQPTRSVHIGPVRPGIVGVIAALLLAGCQSPLQPESPDDIHRRLVESVNRELADLPDDAGPLLTERPPSDVEQTLAPRLEELQTMAGPGSYEGVAATFAADLTGAAQTEFGISLEQAVASAVRNNLSLQVARLQPAIAQTGVARAWAAFDAVFFASVNHNRLDEPSTVPVLGGIPLGSPFSSSDRTTAETGVRQPFATGGELDVSTSISRTDNLTPGFSLSPDPSYLARITFGLNQPLLRGFGTDVNMSQIRLAENADRRAIQELRRSLLSLAQQVEAAYWDLVVARSALLIRTRLLERGIETRDFMQRRADVRGDVRDSELADAMATVERRRAELIRVERRVRAASDRLKQLINAPNLTVGSETLLRPVDVMIEQPLNHNLREILLTAIERRPEIQQAVLDLDNAAIALQVSDNARLPILNLTAQLELVGLNDDVYGAYSSATDDTFINYVLGLLFEQPIGNAAAEADYREARLRQSAAVIAYRNAVQSVVLDVKNALRDVAANYDLISATRTSRLAASENLRAILVDEEFRTAPTPEFLNLKLQRQESLALAELSEVDALANYNRSIARLYEAMGVGLEINQIEMVLPVDGDYGD